MNTSTVFSKLLPPGFPKMSDVGDLTGLQVRLRIQTGPDDYDIIGTTVASARMRLGDYVHEGKWLELTFPPQFVTRNLDSEALHLVCATKHPSEPQWSFYAHRFGLLGILLPRVSLKGQVTPIHSRSVSTARAA